MTGPLQELSRVSVYLNMTFILGGTCVFPLSSHPPKPDSSEHDDKVSIKCLGNFKPQQKDGIFIALKLDGVGRVRHQNSY